MKKQYLLGFISMYLVLVFLLVPTQAYSRNISPSDDAYVDSWDLYDNFGASDYLMVGTFVIGDCVTFLKFQIPESDRAVISAKVSTYWYNFMCETWLSIKAGTTSNSWNEETITYDNCPYFYYEILTTQSITDGDNLNFEVTNYIPSSGAFSVIIWEESATGEYLQGDSKENDLIPDPPFLTITYESRIEDFLPAIIGGTVGGIAGLGAIIGLGLYLRKKKRLGRAEQSEQLVQSKGPQIEESMGPQVEEIGYGFCPQCGDRLISKAQFCKKCGTKLD